MQNAGTRFGPLRWRALVLIFLCLSLAVSHAQSQGNRREFRRGALTRLDQLPPGRLRTQLERMPLVAQERATRWLQAIHFTEADLESMRADRDGGIFYADAFTLSSSTSAPEPVVAAASVPVSPFPRSLVFHSKPGAPNVLYINFCGEVVVNSQWNTDVGRAEIVAVGFSTDSDYTTFSDGEQVAIKRIWQRMAEDYAPFNIDVTTERPATFTTKTAQALITRSTDANGAANPYSNSGGVAYINVFGTINYAKYRPAWIYYDNLGSGESYVGEAASHEVGHNLGLSHDGTSGSEYYGGHGSGDTSWGPLMGSGYGRNVTQWSKGEYYQASNTQDDLATIAGKISYRADDHGDTAGTATGLVISAGTNIVSTTPENDPFDTNTVNKGVLERGTDVDVFSFVTGAGPINVAVKPWIMPSGTRGGNVDIALELYSESGTLLLADDPPSLTTATIQTNLPQGRYFLHVRNSAAGDPFASTPTGYTAYGSIGQYFFSGYITQPTAFVIRPVAELNVSDLTQAGQVTHQLKVTYSDDVAVDIASIDSSDIRVTGPNGYDRTAQLVSVDSAIDGSPRTATYAVSPPLGTMWTPADNGAYTVWMRTNQVCDTEQAWVLAEQLGGFEVAVPVALYHASMDADPGWILEPQWQYGTPSYVSGGPVAGFTGTKILGFNLSGNYAGNLSSQYATTPPINCSGASSVTLRFRRWLRVRPNDPVGIQVSTDGATWTDVWSTSNAVSDTSWQEVQYGLPAWVAGSPSVRLRWSLASNRVQEDIGWNIDDVELLAGGALDTTAPTASLNVANLTQGGAPAQSCSVTYSDQAGVRLSSVDSTDLVVVGPNGYSNLVEFIGADLPMDGSPLTATYSILAPRGVWGPGDNGTYVIALLEGAVEDTVNNATRQAVLGSFTVDISATTPGTLAIVPARDWSSSGSVGGPFSPAATVYTLTNSGGSPLMWSASNGQGWLSLSVTNGTLAAGASTAINVLVTSEANTLAPGSYSDTVRFVNVTSGDGTTSRTVSLSVNGGTAVIANIISFGVTGGELVLVAQGTSGLEYAVQASVDLTSWDTIATAAADAEGRISYREPATGSVKFYRITRLP